MSVKPKATKVYGCVFTSTWTNKAFIDGDVNKGINFDNLTPEEVAAFSALEAAMSKLNNAADAQAYVCPIDYGTNVQVIEQQGFGQNLPAIIISAEYSNGLPTKRYALANTVGGTKLWTVDELYPYVKALYDNADEGKPCGSPWPFSLVIPDKFDAVLCSIPAYVYLAAALYSGYKTYEQRKDPALSVVWGAALLFAGGRFLKSGGFKAIQR